MKGERERERTGGESGEVMEREERDERLQECLTERERLPKALTVVGDGEEGLTLGLNLDDLKPPQTEQQ